VELSKYIAPPEPFCAVLPINAIDDAPVNDAVDCLKYIPPPELNATLLEKVMLVGDICALEFAKYIAPPEPPLALFQ
jgi:hypothetical protein